MFSKESWSSPKYQVVHLVLTWQWIFVGGFAQFVFISIRLKDQDYLSSAWKSAIAISAFLMLGPTMIYVFGLCLIHSYESRWHFILRRQRRKRDVIAGDNCQLQHDQHQHHPRVKDELLFLKATLKRANSFASESRLCEIFFESVPQLLTQLSMTCAKGQEGVKRLSTWQLLSVGGSALTIALGISCAVVERGVGWGRVQREGVEEDVGNEKAGTNAKDGKKMSSSRQRSMFYSENHCRLTTRVIIAIFALSEIAFYGAFARFSFTFNSFERHSFAFNVMRIAFYYLAMVICFGILVQGGIHSQANTFDDFLFSILIFQNHEIFIKIFLFYRDVQSWEELNERPLNFIHSCLSFQQNKKTNKEIKCT